jgi:cobalamin biosynthetic protein CobC
MYHGGNLTEASQTYGTPSEGWLDLSTGINPEPYLLTDVTRDAFARLPQPDAMARLDAAARGAYAVPPDVPLVAGPGTEFLIDALARSHAGASVAVVSPTYGGHGEAWRKAGAAVIESATLEAAEASGAACIVVVNPNNPDARVWSRQQLVDLARGLADGCRQLIVDEAFVDVTPEQSLCPALDRAPALVLRSFGKFYGLAGLRLGFLIGTPAVVARLRAELPPWLVSGPALEVGARTLADPTWAGEARARIADGRDRLVSTLHGAGIEVLGDAGLFVLVRHPRAVELHDRLARSGIWTRVFAHRPDWLRLGLPPADGWPRFEQALAAAVATLEP